PLLPQGPDLDGVVAAGAHQLAKWRKLDATDRAPVGLEAVLLLATGCVPYGDRAILAAGRTTLAVRAEGRRGDGPLMIAFELSRRFVAVTGQVVDSPNAIRAANKAQVPGGCRRRASQ